MISNYHLQQLSKLSYGETVSRLVRVAECHVVSRRSVRTYAKSSFRQPRPQPSGWTSPSGPQQDNREKTKATFVPRRPDVTDGAWDKSDAAAVAEALEDAKRVVDRKFRDHGDVLLGQSLDDLRALAVREGESAYRGKQLQDALLKGAASVDDMLTLPSSFRSHLKSRGIQTGRSRLHHSVSAADGTRKFLMQLHDGLVVETVGIPVDDSNRKALTVCVSSQVGCPMRCTFCATGKGGFARNLAPHEIVDQVLTVQEQFGARVSNVVFMGMGEPLLNLAAVVTAHDILNKQLGIGARHMTISTVGVPRAIFKLAAYRLQSTLAVSIHAPNQQLREQLVPSAKVYPIEVLMKDCQDYFKMTGRRVTFEYTLMSGVNDAPAHAHELAALLKRYDLRGHVNLIPWNPVEESDYSRPARRQVQQFLGVLSEHGVPVSVRVTRGLEAAAACGQLRNMHQKVPLPLPKAEAVAKAEAEAV